MLGPADGGGGGCCCEGSEEGTSTGGSCDGMAFDAVCGAVVLVSVSSRGSSSVELILGFLSSRAQEGAETAMPASFLSVGCTPATNTDARLAGRVEMD